MKAELSVFKIPSSMSGYEKKLIKGVKPITRKELDAKYFPDYVSSEYQINTGQSLKRGGQINSKYFTGNDKEVFRKFILKGVPKRLSKNTFKDFKKVDKTNYRIHKHLIWYAK